MIKKRILIIGSNGMLGQSVVEQFKLDSSNELFLASFEEKSFIPELPYTQIDISDKKAVKNLFMNFYPDYVLNLAAYTNVDKAETEKELCWDVNVNSNEYFAKYCVPTHSHLIYISSDYIFDGKNGPYTENDLPNPISYYGRSKLAGENVIRRFDIPYTIIRTNVLFGATKYGRPDFVKWVYDSLRKGKQINIVTDQINNPTYLNDLAWLIWNICKKSAKGVYNAGGKELLSRFEFANLIAEHFNLDKSLIKPIVTSDLKQPAKRPLRSGLVNIKAESELGYKPKSLNECFGEMMRVWEN